MTHHGNWAVTAGFSLILALAACGDDKQGTALGVLMDATAGATKGEPMLDPSGGLKIELVVIRPRQVLVEDGKDLLVASEYCLTGFDSRDSVADCRADKRPWTPYTLRASLRDLDPASVKVTSGRFGANQNVATVYTLNIQCREDAGKCVEHSAQSPRTSIALPCHSQGACNDAAASLTTLVESGTL